METDSRLREPAIDRAAALLVAIAQNGDTVALADHARSLAIPLSTAYRIVGTLARHGLVAAGRRGHYGPGLRLAELSSSADPRLILTRCARAPVRRLARACRATAHLGIFENDMVTYLVKERGGGAALFTREEGQLEAYCSAIGKILLAHLGVAPLERYLAAGPFVALTGQTVTDPDLIRLELARVRNQGFAIDAQEIADDLVCIAVPVCDQAGHVVAAVSLSRRAAQVKDQVPPEALLACTLDIEARLGGAPLTE